MKVVSITDICDFQGGTQPPKNEWSKEPSEQYIRMLQIRDFTQPDKNNIEYVKKSRKLKCCKADDILIGRYGASVGKILTGLSGAYNVAIIKTIPNKKLLSKEFLFHLLKGPKFQSFISAIGARAAQAGFNKSDLSKFKINLLPIEDQIRIAALLSRAESMIAKRKESLRLQDELLKGIFLEMFGDPVRNEKGWDKLKLKNNFGEISTGNTPPRSNAENYSDDYLEWIKTDNINQNQMYLTPASEFLSETGAKKARVVTKGALLVACIAGSIESIGRSALTDRRVSFNQQINAIQPYPDINPLFLYWLFRISKFYIQSFAPKGMKKILTKGNFEQITMIKPPKEIQDQYASIVEKAEYLKTLYQQSLNELENLYGVLSQKAFKGKLDLSRIPIEPLADAKDLEPEQLPIAFPPLDHKVMADPAAREKLLRQIFKDYFTEHPERTGSFKDFWSSIEFSVSDYMDDESPPLGPADYDKFKTWLFELLKSGGAEQRFNEEKNKMELRTKP